MKRKSLLVALTFLSVHFCAAQSADRKTAFAVYAGTIQYNGEFGNQFFKTDNLQGAYAISIASYVSPSFNLGLMYMRGDVYYTNSVDFLFGNTSNINLFIHYKFFNNKIFKESARIAPYLITGFGGSDWNIRVPENKRFTSAFVPLGIGFRIRITNTFSLLLQSEYHITFSDKYDNTETKKGNDYFLHTLVGLSFSFGEGKDTDGDKVIDRKDHCPNTPIGVAVDAHGCPLDRDSDGIADYLDQCPDLFGYLSAKGCPDKDHDSITDKDDHCPDVSGPRETFGCPDRDQDGVLDADDSCPDAKGIPALNGCPDRDGDGTADKDDLCPDSVGSIANHGCPEIKQEEKENEDTNEKTKSEAQEKVAEETKEEVKEKITEQEKAKEESKEKLKEEANEKAKEETEKLFDETLSGLHFQTGKAIIKHHSYKIMDEVVKVMNAHPEYKLIISGYTDNTGSEKRNLNLSLSRAAAAKKYLTDHNIESSRITANGFGESIPVADNKTKQGKAKNRRVEFKVVVE